MNSEVEFHIRQNYPWVKLPVTVKQVCDISEICDDKQIKLSRLRSTVKRR
jgi:hypothetical protein